MTFPETEVFSSLVSRVLRIEDVTSGDPQKGFILRYRGRLLNEDTVAAYDQLAESLKSHNILPLFRKGEHGEHVILLTQSPPALKPTNPMVNYVLFFLTIISVMMAGAQPQGPIPQNLLGELTAILGSLLTGWPFAVSLLGILLAHEFGHYLMSRYHKTPATLPYFIPFPLSPLGTMGAAILMRGIPKNKRILFDIGVAGPLAGLVVAIPVLFLGLHLSKLGLIEQNGPSFIEGNSLMYLFAKYIMFNKLLPSPATMGGLSPALYWLKYFFTGQPIPFGGLDVFIHPVAFAGWAGLLVTAMNLIPVGTLDGGHVVHGLFGDKARRLFPFVIGALVILGFFWSTWFFWAILLLWLGRVQAEPYDQITELDFNRKLLAVFVLIMFVLVFSPVPITVYGL